MLVSGCYLDSWFVDLGDVEFCEVGREEGYDWLGSGVEDWWEVGYGDRCVKKSFFRECCEKKRDGRFKVICVVSHGDGVCGKDSSKLWYASSDAIVVVVQGGWQLGDGGIGLFELGNDLVMDFSHKWWYGWSMYLCIVFLGVWSYIPMVTMLILSRSMIWRW